MFCRKALFLAGLTLCVSFESICQVVTSAQNGYWHDPSTWIGGMVPSSVNCSQVRIVHPVEIITSVSAPSVEIASSLLVGASGELDIIPPVGGGEIRVQEAGMFMVDGLLVGRDDVMYHAPPDQFRFRDGGRFQYRGESRGFIPVANWHPNSTLLINGFAASGYIAIAYSESWKQEFGNVIYDCPHQPSFVDLNGYLRSIQGDFVVRNTNNQSLRLSTTQRPVIHIGGDFRIEGPSEVWLTTTSDSARIHVAGDFQYHSTSTGPSYFTTRGRCYMEVGGTMQVDATGPLRICSGSADSTGVRRTTFVLNNGLEVNRGTFIAPFPGSGWVVFAGNGTQEVNTIRGAFSGNMNFQVNSDAVADLIESEISTPGSLHVRGHLKVGSPDPAGALQRGTAGNFQTTNAITFYPGSTLEFSGSASQFAGAETPLHNGVHLKISNINGVTLLGDLDANNLTIQRGSFDLNNNAVRINGNLITEPGSTVTDGDIIMGGEDDAALGTSPISIRDLIIEKSQGTEISILGPVAVRRNLEIQNEDVMLISNGFLTLMSSADVVGATASVGRLRRGSSIEGDVTVHRFMSGEGRLYRYISSPMELATVASLKDDFPVTGTFRDPSSGPGIQQTSPSLYYYDAGWAPFPVNGYAAENILQPGRGYAAFVRGSESPVILDFTGRINQGSIQLPVSYNEVDDPIHTGWNLVGNPYASAIDWGHAAGWTRSANMGLVFAIRDNGEGRFRYSDGEVGDANGGLIASGQAFWVHAASTDPELVVHEDAKTNLDAAFFRTRTDVDFLRISVEGNGSRDEVHIRKRTGAASGVDPADAIKRWNDRLSLSVLSSDNVPLALSAVDTILCEQSYRLKMNYPPDNQNRSTVLPPGSYTLNTEGFGLFRSSDLLLIDTFSGDTVNAYTYSFSVSDDPGSAAMDRFILRVRSEFSEIEVIHSVPPDCGDSLALVQLNEPGPYHARYFALANGNEYEFDNAGKVFIPLNENGSQTISVVVRNICQTMLLDEVTITPPPKAETPLVQAQPRCGPGQVSLEIQNPEPGTTWYWYDDARERICLSVSRSPIFLTPVLHKSKTYYVVAENQHGCRSYGARVEALIIPIESFDVWAEHGILHSSLPSTEWYNESGWLHTGVSFEPPAPGDYTARNVMSGCIIEKVISFGKGSSLDLFPVPFTVQLHLVSGQPIQKLEVYDIYGKVVLELEMHDPAHTIDTRDWPAGVFLVDVVLSDATRVRRRIVKR